LLLIDCYKVEQQLETCYCELATRATAATAAAVSPGSMNKCFSYLLDEIRMDDAE
jgi:hypothetical protein